MAVSAVEQLQVMASKRQYKEAAAQLEVTYLLSTMSFYCRRRGAYVMPYVILSLLQKSVA